MQTPSSASMLFPHFGLSDGFQTALNNSIANMEATVANIPVRTRFI